MPGVIQMFMWNITKVFICINLCSPQVNALLALGRWWLRTCITGVLLGLIRIPHFKHQLPTSFNICYRFSAVRDISTISSEYNNMDISCPPAFTPRPKSFTSVAKSLIKTENKVGDKESHCLSPLSTWNHSVYILLILTQLFVSLYRALTAK